MTTRDHGVKTPETVWILWHGGSSYAAGYVDDDTEGPMPTEDAQELMRARWANRDGSTPCVDESSEAHVFYRDPRGESDPYPDALLRWCKYRQRFVWDWS